MAEKHVPQITIEEEAAFLNDALDSDEHAFWKYMAEDVEGGMYSAAHIKDFRQAFQEADDEERKAKGLEPRPWSDIAQTLEKQFRKTWKTLVSTSRKPTPSSVKRKD